ncbi:MAG: hypothetical protein ACI8WB_005113 [Phenylobacterium sp.]|jgi:hypothetical protein
MFLIHNITDEVSVKNPAIKTRANHLHLTLTYGLYIKICATFSIFLLSHRTKVGYDPVVGFGLIASWFFYVFVKVSLSCTGGTPYESTSYVLFSW